MREIKEPDWEVLRRVHPLERFCKRVLAEIDRVSRERPVPFKCCSVQGEAPYTSTVIDPGVQAIGCEVDFAPPME
jgi:hypothetical protein